jgi:starvation-inducible DNA-binding protein
MANRKATRNDLPPPVRAKMIALLNQQLADTFDLFSQTKQAHWNVKGMQFHALHELFDKLAANLGEHTDTLAERVAALGGTALGTVRMAAAATRLREVPVDFEGSEATVRVMAERYAELAKSTRRAIDKADEEGDADTADLFTGISRDLDKHLWFLEAHLG